MLRSRDGGASPAYVHRSLKLYGLSASGDAVRAIANVLSRSVPAAVCPSTCALAACCCAATWWLCVPARLAPLACAASRGQAYGARSALLVLPCRFKQPTDTPPPHWAASISTAAAAHSEDDTERAFEAIVDAIKASMERTEGT